MVHIPLKVYNIVRYGIINVVVTNDIRLVTLKPQFILGCFRFYFISTFIDFIF